MFSPTKQTSKCLLIDVKADDKCCGQLWLAHVPYHTFQSCFIFSDAGSWLFLDPLLFCSLKSTTQTNKFPALKHIMMTWWWELKGRNVYDCTKAVIVHSILSLSINISSRLSVLPCEGWSISMNVSLVEISSVICLKSFIISEISSEYEQSRGV
jgi:hypothetical protein